MEQVDDPEHVQLIVVWESQMALEQLRSSEAGECINRALRNSDRLRILSIQSHSYIIRVKPSEGLPTGQTPEIPYAAQSGSEAAGIVNTSGLRVRSYTTFGCAKT